MIKNKKIFITGGAGFLGKELIKRFYDNNDIRIEINLIFDNNNESIKYSTLEYNYLDLVQNFSECQIELEHDFVNILDELLLSKINSSPSKKRF